MPGTVETLDLAVIGDSRRSGLAALAAEANDAADFEQRLQADGLRASVARGGLLNDAKSLFDRLRGRRLMADLGVFPARVDWLGFHVPQGGSGKLTLAATTEGKGTLGLTLAGFGGGEERTFMLETEDDFGERKECFHLGVDVEVRLRTFAEGGAAEANTMQVDVQQLLRMYLRAEPVCPLCFSGPEKPLRAKPSGDGWDLTADSQGLTKKYSYELGETQKLEVGLDLPLVKTVLKPAVEMSRTLKGACTASYTFPGGACFTGYRMIGRPLDLPFWGRT